MTNEQHRAALAAKRCRRPQSTVRSAPPAVLPSSIRSCDSQSPVRIIAQARPGPSAPASPAASAARGASVVDNHVLMQRVRAVANRAQAVKRGDAKRRREVPVRCAARAALAKLPAVLCAPRRAPSRTDAADAGPALHRRPLHASADLQSSRADRSRASARIAASMRAASSRPAHAHINQRRALLLRRRSSASRRRSTPTFTVRPFAGICERLATRGSAAPARGWRWRRRPDRRRRATRCRGATISKLADALARGLQPRRRAWPARARARRRAARARSSISFRDVGAAHFLVGRDQERDGGTLLGTGARR